MLNERLAKSVAEEILIVMRKKGMLAPWDKETIEDLTTIICKCLTENENITESFEWFKDKPEA